MSDKTDPPVVSTVQTRSQTSKTRADGVDTESQPRVGDDKDKRRKSEKANSQASSEVNMALFGDVDYHNTPMELNSESMDDVSSVASNLHVTLDEIRKSVEKKLSAKSRSKVSSKSGSHSKGSMTQSELIRINLEIKKLELEE